MAFTEKTFRKVASYLFIALLILFPFGQVLRIEWTVFHIYLVIHPIEVVTFLSFVLMLLKYKLRFFTKPFVFLISILMFTLILALMKYSEEEVIRGSLYLVRLVFVYSFFKMSLFLYQTKTITRVYVEKLLLRVFSIIALLGWIQYLFIPDLRFLKYFSWDDHLNRLTGTFLDPGYMGIIMVLASLYSITLYFAHKKLKYLYYSLPFIVTVFLTYSRASFLSLFVSLCIVLVNIKKIKYLFILLFVFLSIVLALPRSESEGVKLERTQSITDRFQNYQETSMIISQNPLFGVGFNTICSEKVRLFNDEGVVSHSCSGADSSILFILATSGVIGLLAFSVTMSAVYRQLDSESIFYKFLFVPSTLAILVHSLFSNTLFYLWVLLIMGLFTLFTLKENKLL